MSHHRSVDDDVDVEYDCSSPSQRSMMMMDDLQLPIVIVSPSGEDEVEEGEAHGSNVLAAAEAFPVNWKDDLEDSDVQFVNDDFCGIGILSAPLVLFPAAHSHCEWFSHHPHDQEHDTYVDEELIKNYSSSAFYDAAGLLMLGRSRAVSDGGSCSSTSGSCSTTSSNGTEGCGVDDANADQRLSNSLVAAAEASDRVAPSMSTARSTTKPHDISSNEVGPRPSAGSASATAAVAASRTSDVEPPPMDVPMDVPNWVLDAFPTVTDPMLRPTPDEVGWATTPRQQQSLVTWYRRVHELVHYRDTHDGNCHVPQAVKPLGTWCNKQREEYKSYRGLLGDPVPSSSPVPRQRASSSAGNTSMTSRRVQVLEFVGFQWAKPKGEASWKSHYDELVRLKNESGTIRVPLRIGAGRGGSAECGLDTSRIKSLGRWITEQRKQKSLWDAKLPSRLTHDRVQKLEDLGFDWGQPRIQHHTCSNISASANSATQRGTRKRPLPPPVVEAKAHQTQRSSSPPRRRRRTASASKSPSSARRA